MLKFDESGGPLIDQLRNALASNFGRVVDLFKDWDDDGNGMVNRTEFRKVLPMLGLKVDREVPPPQAGPQGPAPLPRQPQAVAATPRNMGGKQKLGWVDPTPPPARDISHFAQPFGGAVSLPGDK